MSTNINYYLTLDSQFRNRNQYATSTDFGVSFVTQDSTTEYPQGEPLDSTQFFPRVTIDKNAEKSELRIVNGTSNNVIFDNVNKNYIYTGYIHLADYTKSFTILYRDVIVVTVNNINNTGVEWAWEMMPYFFAINDLGVFQWLVYGYRNNTIQNPLTNFTQWVSVNIINNLYYFSFAYNANISFNKVTVVNDAQTVTPLYYDVTNPYNNGQTAGALLVFTHNGNPYIDARGFSSYYNFHTIADPNGTSAPFNLGGDDGSNYVQFGFTEHFLNVINDSVNNIFVGVQINNSGWSEVNTPPYPYECVLGNLLL
jgi:hypothetical protein